MDIRLINRGAVGELQLDGSLDTNAAMEAEEIFKEIAGRFDSVILDMEGLRYVSSSGLRILKNLHMDLKKKGGDLMIKNVGKSVMEVFEMTGIVCLFHFI